MASEVAARPVTAGDFLMLPDDGVRRELRRGELVTMVPPGYRQGRLVAALAAKLGQHVAAGDLGDVLAGRPRRGHRGRAPGDSYSDLQEKALEWLAAGARLVLVVDPRRWTVTTYRSADRIVELSVGQILDADDGVPGWSVPVEELFS